MSMSIIDEIFQHYQDYCFLLLFLCSVSTLIIFHATKTKNKAVDRKLKLPPSPPSLPFLGHLHHLFSSSGLYKSLHHLAGEYGPLVYLRLGSTTLVLASSPSMAAQIFKTQDTNFACRPKFSYADKILYGAYSFINAPYGDYWRFLKKLCVNELLGSHQVDHSRFIRSQELDKLLGRVMESAERSAVIDVSVELVKFTNNVLCRMAMSTVTDVFTRTDQAEELRGLLKQSFELAGKLYVGQMLGPFKSVVLWLYGQKVADLNRRFDQLLEKILKEHEHDEMNGADVVKENKDLMDILLEVHRDEKARVKITRSNIKAFFTDLIIAGTDSSAQTMQWVIAELINHPHVLRKVREEIKLVVGITRLVKESDIPKLPYLQAVVKETLRLHPAAPITTRLCRESCKVEDFDIPKNTPVAINLYTIMRDPNIWENPNDFIPERMLDLNTDSKGQSFNFIPFGAGRRGCPATLLAFAVMNTVIAATVQCFDWKIDSVKVNMQSGKGMSLGMAHPLRCVPVVLFNPFSSAESINNAARFKLQNRCNTTLWPGIQAGAGHPQIMNGGLQLQAGKSIDIEAPTGWSGRFWGRRNCSFDTQGRGSCLTGDCAGLLQCAGTGGVPPATLAEFTLDSPMDFYDISLVDGFNLPISITPLKGTGNHCRNISCISDLNNRCPRDLQVIKEGKVVACNSACQVFNEPQYCCTGDFGSPNTCNPSEYSKLFKAACPDAYSYAFDDSTSICTCKGADYLISFC
ncbi:hypothetical protein RDABS01_023818 [Bienertia sinuspersici]